MSKKRLGQLEKQRQESPPAGLAKVAVMVKTVGLAKPKPIPKPSKVQVKKKQQPRSRFSGEYGLLLGRLIAARQAAGLTQIEVAKRIGKTQSHVSMCENREREFSVVDVYRWCAAVGVCFSDMMRQFECDVEAMDQVYPTEFPASKNATSENAASKMPSSKMPAKS